MKKTKVLHLSQIILSLIGLFVSLFLLFKDTRLKSGIQENASSCSINQYIDCDVVSASAYSELFGVSVSWLGGGCFFSRFYC